MRAHRVDRSTRPPENRKRIPRLRRVIVTMGVRLESPKSSRRSDLLGTHSVLWSHPDRISTDQSVISQQFSDGWFV